MSPPFPRNIFLYRHLEGRLGHRVRKRTKSFLLLIVSSQRCSADGPDMGPINVSAPVTLVILSI